MPRHRHHQPSPIARLHESGRQYRNLSSRHRVTDPSVQQVLDLDSSIILDLVVLMPQLDYGLLANYPLLTVNIGPYIVCMRVHPDVGDSENRLGPQRSGWID